MEEQYARNMIFYFEFLEKKRRKRKRNEAKEGTKETTAKALMKKRIDG